MDEQGKVDKLKTRANVSEEEAREALLACDGDLLDAMVYLEKKGETLEEETRVYSTAAEDKSSYEDVTRVVSENKDSGDPSFGEQLLHLIKIGFRKSVDNYLVVSHKGVERFRIPILVFLILIFISIMSVLVAMVVSLFFDVRYSFTGKDDLSKVNEFMDDAGSRASTWMKQVTAEAKKNENKDKD